MLPGLIRDHGVHMAGPSVNLVPTFTSASAVNGITIVGSTEIVGDEAWKAGAHDGSTTYWQSNGVAPQQLTLDFVTPQIASSYALTARNDAGSGNAPGNFTFEGSNEGVAWTVLDTRTGETFTAGQRKTYTPTNFQAFRKYRVNTSSTPLGTAVAIAELEIFN